MVESEDLANDAAKHRLAFTLWRRQWASYRPSVPLVWKDHPFDAGTKGSIPGKPGVYAFLVQPGIVTGLTMSYLLYLGKSNDLRRRYGEYLREVSSLRSRPKIQRCLSLYSGYVRFSYAAVPDEANRSRIESDLVTALTPPLNSIFPAEIRRAMVAFT